MSSKVRRTGVVLLLAATAILIATRSYVAVDESEYVVVTEFGRPLIVYGDDPGEAGFHGKAPWTSAIRVDRRLRATEPPARELMTRDKRNLEVAPLVLWRVADPLRFLAASGTIIAAADRLDERVGSAIASVLGSYALEDLTASEPDASQIDEMTAQVIADVSAPARAELGVELIDLKLRRFNYPLEVRPAVFALIRSERAREAARLRAEGEAEYRKLVSAADRERSERLARADADAERARAIGEAEATRTLNAAHSRDPEFYALLRTLETYRAVLDGRATLVLSAASPLLKLLAEGPNLRPAPSQSDEGVASKSPEKTAYGNNRARVGVGALRRRSWGIAAGLLGLAAGLIYGATGLAVVEPGRVVVVRRFGRALPEPWGPGPHLGLPWGFERRDTVRIGEVRRVEVGVVERPGIAGGLGAGEFLTGDLNLVRLRAQIRYRVADPVAFVVATDDPSGLLARLAESAIARTVAARGIDGLLGPDRAILAASTRDRLARDTDRAGIGVAILAVGFSEVRPAGRGPRRLRRRPGRARRTRPPPDRSPIVCRCVEVRRRRRSRRAARRRRDRSDPDGRDGRGPRRAVSRPARSGPDRPRPDRPAALSRHAPRPAPEARPRRRAGPGRADRPEPVRRPRSAPSRSEPDRGPPR